MARRSSQLPGGGEEWQDRSVNTYMTIIYIILPYIFANSFETGTYIEHAKLAVHTCSSVTLTGIITIMQPPHRFDGLECRVVAHELLGPYPP
jgi:hypothetical protein